METEPNTLRCDGSRLEVGALPYTHSVPLLQLRDALPLFLYPHSQDVTAKHNPYSYPIAARKCVRFSSISFISRVELAAPRVYAFTFYLLTNDLLDLSVDLRDAVGDRLYLSDGFRRDGTLFDIGQATALQEHAAALSVRQAVAQSRRSRGFFATLFRKVNDGYRPTYNYQPDGSACRVYGTIEVKKVTGLRQPLSIVSFLT